MPGSRVGPGGANPRYTNGRVTALSEMGSMTDPNDAYRPPEYPVRGDSDFPNAPPGWSRESALATAKAEDLEIVDDHWEIIRAIQDYLARRDARDINVRELLDALDEKFYHKGGKKYLYRLLPAGPVAQGFRLAGLQSPPGSVDHGFGSVQ